MSEESLSKGLHIKEKIDYNNKLLERLIQPNIFTLNNTVAEILTENAALQQECPHRYDEDGFCIFCYKMKEGE